MVLEIQRTGLIVPSGGLMRKIAFRQHHSENLMRLAGKCLRKAHNLSESGAIPGAATNLLLAPWRWGSLERVAPDFFVANRLTLCQIVS